MKRSKVASFSLPQETINYMDEIARSENKNRSEVVREAIKAYRVSKGIDEIRAIGVRQAKSQGTEIADDVEQVIREYRDLQTRRKKLLALRGSITAAEAAAMRAEIARSRKKWR